MLLFFDEKRGVRIIRRRIESSSRHLSTTTIFFVLWFLHYVTTFLTVSKKEMHSNKPGAAKHRLVDL